MSAAWLPKRGKIHGCGMAVIPLDDGVVRIPAIVKALKQVGFAGTTTLEIAGAENVKLSAKRLRDWARCFVPAAPHYSNALVTGAPSNGAAGLRPSNHSAVAAVSQVFTGAVIWKSGFTP